ncbi:micrococcal nuclease [Nitrosospira sp. Nsp11]|uniref:thermonuclease family protein n=1 Tax=Nitrosospira sp. Nsp11 TaxID=1855338 RepID=UPI000924960E|nr:thermonuclease family protein [Nitrosospira sp. Nsp11]SHL41626.1 micrococcal nuclease [Nitrosospira sp. Nsp11]
MLLAAFLATVIGISDGDTLTVLTPDKQQIKIRLAEIDAPEKRQAFGTRSKQSLSDLCFGKQAEVKPQAKDRYKRTVARIKCDGVDANAEQVSRGMAWVYRQYAKDHDLYVLEHGAKVEKRGLWSEPSPIPPWEFRKMRRHTLSRVVQYV